MLMKIATLHLQLNALIAEDCKTEADAAWTRHLQAGGGEGRIS